MLIKLRASHPLAKELIIHRLTWACVLRKKGEHSLCSGNWKDTPSGEIMASLSENTAVAELRDCIVDLEGNNTFVRKALTFGIVAIDSRLPNGGWSLGDGVLERAAAGASFTIAKAGKPLGRVIPINPISKGPPSRVGFLGNRFSVPDDFDRMDKDEIETQFGFGVKLLFDTNLLLCAATSPVKLSPKALGMLKDTSVTPLIPRRAFGRWRSRHGWDGKFTKLTLDFCAQG